MISKLMILGSLIFLPLSASALPLDKFAHAVGSYGLTHATQAICNRVTEGEHKTGCLITGVAVAGTIAAAKEVADQMRNKNTVKESLMDGAADVTGIGLAVIFIQIDF